MKLWARLAQYPNVAIGEVQDKRQNGGVERSIPDRSTTQGGINGRAGAKEGGDALGRGGHEGPPVQAFTKGPPVRGF